MKILCILLNYTTLSLSYCLHKIQTVLHKSYQPAIILTINKLIISHISYKKKKTHNDSAQSTRWVIKLRETTSTTSTNFHESRCQMPSYLTIIGTGYKYARNNTTEASCTNIGVQMSHRIWCTSHISRFCLQSTKFHRVTETSTWKCSGIYGRNSAVWFHWLHFLLEKLPNVLPLPVVDPANFSSS